MPNRLGALDAAFLYLEKPHVHMHVAGLAILDPSTRPDGRLTLADISRLIEQRIHLVPRFRQKAVAPPLRAGRPVWVDDEDFDLSFHLRRAALPAPGGRKELAEFVARVQSRQLDRTKPLWEAYLIEGLEHGHVAALVKSHHAMTDGIGGMDIGTVLFDFTPEPQEVTPQPWTPEPEPSQMELLRQALTEQVAHPVRTMVEGAGKLLSTPAVGLERARRTVEGLRSLYRSGPPPPGPFNVTIGPNRRFAMAEVPVADAKAVKNALGGTVNDVVLAAVAGGLHRFLASRRYRTRGATLRAMIPVSTRDDSERMTLGNKVSMFFVDLPVGRMEAATRLKRVSAATKELKSSHQAVAASSIMELGTWAPPTLHALAARLIARQRFANLLISNVPGPQVPLYLAGARMAVTYPVMPLGETLGLSVAVTSLSGTMGFGLTGDWDAVPDIDALADGLLEAFQDLKKAASA